MPVMVIDRSTEKQLTGEKVTQNKVDSASWLSWSRNRRKKFTRKVNRRAKQLELESEPQSPQNVPGAEQGTPRKQRELQSEPQFPQDIPGAEQRTPRKLESQMENSVVETNQGGWDVAWRVGH